MFRDCRVTLSRHTDAAFLDCTSTGCSSSQAGYTAWELVGSVFDRCTVDLMTVEACGCAPTSASSRDAGVAAHRPGGILADERATDPDDRSPPHAHRDP